MTRQRLRRSPSIEVRGKRVRFRVVMVLGLLLLPSCLYEVREKTDRVICDLAAHPYDPQTAETPESAPAAPSDKPAAPSARPAAAGPAVDVQTSTLLGARPGSRSPDSGDLNRALDREPVALVQADRSRDEALEAIKRRLERLKIPEGVPGAEAPPIKIPREPAARAAAIRELYSRLPPLPAELRPAPGPNGHPYTLAELQQLAAANSPTLRQAASDVEAARGAWIQASAYPNPTITVLNAEPSNDGSTPGVWGMGIDQTVKTFGKLKLSAAAAEMDLRNAELALKRARSDLSTVVRNAYFAVLVAQETERVTRALARFTDEVYLAQADVLQGGFAAPYEPAALRVQARTVRLALKQALDGRIFAWKQLVAAVGLRQLPLSEVAGRIDQAIPTYDYDTVLAHVLNNHTDVLTARNTVDKARYNLKLAQITPYPDVEFNVQVLKEFVVPPMQVTPTVTVNVPFPLWDHNKGNIMAAEAALVRASDEPHRVETALTTSLAAAYLGYQNSLAALEDYRRYILPDLVRTYRGVFERRRIDPSLGFVDLVSAQQGLVSGVTTYLGVLGSLWTSVVSVADLLQTDDLFQLAQPHELPPVLDLGALPPWLCEHPCAPLAPARPAAGACGPPPATGAGLQGKCSSPPQAQPAAEEATSVSPQTAASWPPLAPRQSFRDYWRRPDPAPELLPEPPPPPPVPHTAAAAQTVP